MQYLFPTVAKMFHHWTGPYEAEGHLLHTGQWNTGCIDAVGTAHRQAHSSQLSSAAMPLIFIHSSILLFQTWPASPAAGTGT